MSEVPESKSRYCPEETLSALMDGEAGELEIRRILKQSRDDAEVLKTWERYHHVSAVIRQQHHSRNPENLLARIQEGLSEEPTPAASPLRNHQFTRILKNVAQGAIAAGVTLAVLLTINTSGNMGAGSPNTLASETATDASLPRLNGEYTVSEFSRTASFEEAMDEEARDRLRQAVYRELDSQAEASVIPVNYSFEE